LTVINLSADVCTAYFQKYTRGGPEEEAVQDIKEQVKKIADLVKSLRSFSQRSSGQRTFVNLAEPVHNALTFFRQQFRSRRIVLIEEIDEKLPMVKTNQQRLEQIAVNLFSNARYAVEKKKQKKTLYDGKITVKLCRGSYSQENLITMRSAQDHSPSEAIFFEVSDNGIGMNEEVRKRCLEPFYTTWETGEGTGLGLTVSYNLIKSLGYVLEIENREDVGSTFRVVIPLDHDQQIYKENS
jgi:histidine kinase